MYNNDDQQILLNVLPFKNLSNYDIELLFENSKIRIQKLMSDHRLITFLKEQKLSNIFNSNDYTSCEYYDEEEFVRLQEGIESLKVFSLNIRSLPLNGGQLVNFLNLLKSEFHIIILTEIGAKNLSLVENLISTHHPLEIAPPVNNPRGGVGIFISKSIVEYSIARNIAVKKTCDCSSCQFESLFINFQFKEQKYVIAGVYRHPNGNTSHFTTALEQALLLCDTNRTIIYCADSNIDIINYTVSHVENFLTMLLNNKFLPFITLPTRVTEKSATCIDHIFIKFSHNNRKLPFPDIDSGIFFCDISDHLPCFISLKYPKSVESNKRPKIRLFGEKNSLKFKTLLTEFEWDNTYQNSTDCFDRFFKQIKIFFEEAFPLVTLSRKRSHDKPWITNSLKISISQNHKLYKKYLKQSSEHAKHTYLQYNKILKKCLKSAETMYYHKLFDDKKNATVNVWKTLGPLINPSKYKKKTTINKIKENDKYITNKTEISEALNRYFCNVGKHLQEQILNEEDNSYLQYMPDRLPNSFYLSPVCEDDVRKEIKRLDPKKAAGPDNIGNKILLMCPNFFSNHLTRIYNFYIEIGEYPTPLKIAKVIPIFKKCKHELSCNYRPISLLSVFNKLFERLICKQLVNFLEKHHILYDFQYGYRKIYSTTLALIELTDSVRRLVDSGNIVFSLFIDFTKAFDTVDHDILLNKLNFYGIRGHAHKFFTSYLSGRSQFLLANGVESTVQSITCGVPQGSVLGPILFLVYINDLHRCVDNCEIRMFADDTSLTVHHKNPTELKIIATNKIKCLLDWCTNNKVTINFDKTNFILFHAKNKSIPAEFNQILVRGSTIKRVSSVKYLGVYIDEMFTWRDHISYIYKSLLKYYGIFNQIKHTINRKIIRQFYFAFIYSKIKYGIEVFGTCSKEQLHRLQVIQSGLLKLLLKVDRRSNTNDLHHSLRLLKVQHIYKMNLILLVNSCLLNRSTPYFNSYFTLRSLSYPIRNQRLDTDLSRINIGQSTVKNIASKEWAAKPAEFKNVSKQLNSQKYVAPIS